MTDHPERYVTLAELSDELPFGEEAFPHVDDWTAFLERLLGEETERIENSQYAGRRWEVTEDWDGTVETVPGPIKNGVVRLVRSRLNTIRADGVESEAAPTGQSVTYRHPNEVRRDVQSMVAKFRPGPDEDADHGRGAWVV